MTVTRRMTWLLLALLCAAGCGTTATTSGPLASSEQIIRVRLLAGVNAISISATANPRLSIDGDPNLRELIFPKTGAVSVWRDSGHWRIGAADVAGGVMILSPGPGGDLSVNENPYRGSLRLVPAGAGFDVVNDVEIDDYLKGVLARELYRDWHIEAYKAQAVVARTYALYHTHTDGQGRYWDVYPDERSQVYGGLSAETPKSVEATDQTAGLVLTYGDGEGKIFEAFFSSDSGGVAQAAADAFGGPSIPPLAARDERGCDNLSPYRNWGPISVTTQELTRRMRLWAVRRDPPPPEAAMATVTRVDIQSLNPFGRPRAFEVTDANGLSYLLTAEEMRLAFNADAPPGGTLPSSFCKVGLSPDERQIVFYDGHGLGHGVGMSQWSAQQHALEGQSYDQILLTSYPQAKIERAY